MASEVEGGSPLNERGSGKMKLTLNIPPPLDDMPPPPPPDDDSGPIFTPRTAAARNVMVSKAAMAAESGEQKPKFWIEPNSLPAPMMLHLNAGESKTDLAANVWALGLKKETASGFPLSDAPLFTPRSAPTNPETGEPIFTPRTLYNNRVQKRLTRARSQKQVGNGKALPLNVPAGVVIPPKADDDMPLFTPRTLQKRKEELELSAEDLPIFTPRGSPVKKPESTPSLEAPSLEVDVEDSETASAEASSPELVSPEGSGKKPAKKKKMVDGKVEKEKPSKSSKEKKSPKDEGAGGEKGKKKSPAKKAKPVGSAPKDGTDSARSEEPSSPTTSASHALKAETVEHLREDAREDAHTFLIDILDAEENVLSSLGTELGWKALTHKVGRGLIQPAVLTFQKGYGTKVTGYRIMMNGLELSGHETLSSLVARDKEFHGGANEATQLLICLQGDKQSAEKPHAEQHRFAPLGALAAGGRSISRHLSQNLSITATRLSRQLSGGTETATFQIDFESSEGVALASLGTALRGRWMREPLTKSVIATALDEFKRTSGITVNPLLCRVTLDGDVLEMASTAKAMDYLYEREADTPIHIVIALPPEVTPELVVAEHKIESATFYVDIVTSHEEGAEHYELQTQIGKKLLGQPLREGLIVPALKSYAEAHPQAPRYSPDSFSILVEGHAFDGSQTGLECAVKYNKTGFMPIHLLLTLAADAADIAHAKHIKNVAYTIDINTSDGNTVFAFGTMLNGRWLHEPLRKAIVASALTELQKHHQGLEKIDPQTIPVTVDGLLVDAHSKAKARTYAHAGEGAAAHVVITLPASVDTSALSSGPAKIESATFFVDIAPADGSAHFETETVLNRKWLLKSLKEALIGPAIRCYNEADESAPGYGVGDYAVFVEGVQADIGQQAISFVTGVDGPVHVALTPKEGEPEELFSRTIKSAQFTIEIEYDGQKIFAFDTVLNQKWLEMPLIQAVVVPALKELSKANGHKVDFNLHVAMCKVDGRLLEKNTKVKALSCVRNAHEPTEIVLTLADSTDVNVAKLGARHRAEPIQSAIFYVDLVTISRGEETSHKFEAMLPARALRSSLGEVVVKPALRGLQLKAHVNAVLILIDDEEVEAKQIAGSFLQGASNPVNVKLIVPESAIASKSKPASLPPPGILNVKMTGGAEDWDMETQLSQKWQQKTLMHGIIIPALHAYEEDFGIQHEPSMIKVKVDGVEVDSGIVIKELFKGSAGVDIELALPATYAVKLAK